MTQPVLLTIVSRQRFLNEKPETTKLVTEGSLTEKDGVLELSYQETELTGLTGTTTSFRIEPKRVTLTRTGTLESQMIFEQGCENRSLYDMGFGALMITVRAESIRSTMTALGGKLSVRYAVAIEEETAGTIDYLIEARMRTTTEEVV